MDDFDELSFVIPGYTPETIPLGRLIEYLQQMVIILGDPSDLHLIEVLESSARPVLHAPRAVALEARESARRVQLGNGTRRQRSALSRVSGMVRRDVSGTANEGKPALLKLADQVILEIPAALDEADFLEGLRQATIIDGELIKVGGAGKEASLQLQDLSGRTVTNLKTTREIAKQLGQLLYETVRLSGLGIWQRDSEGVWSLNQMQVQSFVKLETEDVKSTLDRLRSLTVNWPDDYIDRLHAERKGEE